MKYTLFILCLNKTADVMQVESYNLSLADPTTYKDISLKHNVNFTFFSRTDIETYNETT